MITIKMTWRRQPNETGLRRVGQTERGWELRMGTVDVASTHPKYRGWSREKEGYYWVARLDIPEIPLMNTAGDPVSAPGRAIKDVEDYVKKYIPNAKINRAALTKAGIEIPK